MPDKPASPNQPVALDANAALVFVRVVRAGSFTRAAQALAMPMSTVSDKVSQLERQLGVTLLNRTTRRLSLTELGKEFFAQAEAGMSLLQVAAERAVQARGVPRGLLRITAPADLAPLQLARSVADYRHKYPEVHVETYLTNRYVDLLAEGFDLAVRGGHLRDSGLMAKRLGSGYSVLVASPEYARRAKLPKDPRELGRHRCIRYLSGARPETTPTWRLRSHDGRTVTVRPDCAVAADSFAMVIDLARVGEGIALVPESVIRDFLQKRELLRVLPSWATAEAPLHLVYPAQRQTLPKVKAMIPILEAHLRSLFLE